MRPAIRCQCPLPPCTSPRSTCRYSSQHGRIDGWVHVLMGAGINTAQRLSTHRALNTAQCTNTRARTHTHTHPRAHPHQHPHTHTRAHLRALSTRRTPAARTRTRARTHTSTHPHTHTAHAHTHTCKHPPARPLALRPQVFFLANAVALGSLTSLPPPPPGAPPPPPAPPIGPEWRPNDGVVPTCSMRSPSPHTPHPLPLLFLSPLSNSSTQWPRCSYT